MKKNKQIKTIKTIFILFALEYEKVLFVTINFGIVMANGIKKYRNDKNGSLFR